MFCDQCNHMLFPVVEPGDDEDSKPRLVYECRGCNERVGADGHMIFRRVLKADALVSAYHMPDDVISDPTLPRTRKTQCPKCLNREAVFYQSNSTGADAMTLYFVCCTPGCGERWTGKGGN
ncbi:MAG: hypothetical protein Q8P67_10590 [archaeon]|nr:hypothetical protein [archaeon]